MTNGVHIQVSAITMAQGARVHIPDHREARRIRAGKEGDHIVEKADLRLIQEGPEIADNRRGQHHRKHDDRRPQIVALEFLVDQIGQREADQHLQNNGPDQEMRRRLHRVPDIWISQDASIVSQPNPFDIIVRAVHPEIGEAQPDRPDQRKDINGEQQKDRRRHKYPSNRSIRQASYVACHHRAVSFAHLSMGTVQT